MAGAWVFYFIQGQDGESIQSLNAINVKGTPAREVRLGQFLDSLPPLGANGTKNRYHCRFRVSDPTFGYCWLDCSDPSALLPVHEDMICGKLLCLDDLPRPRPSRLRRKPVGGNWAYSKGGGSASSNPSSPPSNMYNGVPSSGSKHGHAGSAGSPTSTDPQPPPSISRHRSAVDNRAPSPVPAPEVDLFGGSNQPSATKSNAGPSRSTPALTPPRSASGPNSGGDLLNFHDEGPSHTKAVPTPSASMWPPPPAASPAFAGSSGSPPQSNRKSAPPAPTLGGGPPSGAGAAAWSAGGALDIDDETIGRSGHGLGGPTLGDAKTAGKSAYVAACMEEREKWLQEEGQKAVKVKKDRDAAQEKEQEELDVAKQKLDASLTAWAEDHGRKRNVRTLLSTMHTVLWEGSKWTPVGMGDLLAPDKVKLCFRKAMRVIHPDKCADATVEQKFIAKRVFEAVNEAYSTFAADEMPS